MNRIRVSIAAVLFPLLVWGGAWANAADPMVPQHLAEAVDLALKARPELSTASERAHLAGIKADEARGAFFPTLDATGSNFYIHSYDTFTGINISAQVAGQDVAVRVEREVPFWQLVPQLDFNYNLYAGGRDEALLGAAQSGLESAGYAQECARRKVLLEVADAYWELKKAQIARGAAQRAVGLVRQEVAVAKTRRELGRLSDVDDEALRLKEREKELALRTADRDARRAFDHYRHVLGLSEAEGADAGDAMPVLLDSPDAPIPPPAPLPAHPDILRLGSELREASRQKRAAEAEKYPKVDFFAKYALIGRGTDTAYEAWAQTRSDNYAVGVKVSLNLYDGDRTRDRIREADAAVRLKQLELTQKERELAEARSIRLSALEASEDELSLARARHRLAAAREKADLARLNSGRISDLAYRQTAADAQDAADNVEMARIDVALAKNALALIVLP